MKRDGENIIIPVKAVVAIIGALITGGGVGAYGVTSASAGDMDSIQRQLGQLKEDLCELRNDFRVSKGEPPRNCR